MHKAFHFLAAVTALSLTACSGPNITPQDVALQKEQIASEERKEVAKAKADKAEVDAIAKLDPAQQGMAFSSKMMRDVVALVIGKDERKPMGFYEMKERIAAQQNALIDKTTDRVLDASLIGGGIAAAHDLGKHAINKAGDRIKIKGDNNAIELNKTNARSRTDTNQIGDNNNTGPSDANAAGPDKSSTVTEIAAPEEPVVEEPEVPEGEFVPTEPPAHFDDLPVDIPEIPTEVTE